MADKEDTIQTRDDVDPGRIVRWIAAMVLGTGTELLTQCLREFGDAVRHGPVDFDLHAFFYIGLGILIIVVPIYFLSKASEELTDRSTERIIFILSLLSSAFFMPPLSWFAHLASGLPPLH